MDFATIGGIVGAIVGLVIAILMEGSLGSFFGPSAIIIISSITFGATLASFSIAQMKALPKIIRQAFTASTVDAASLIGTIVKFAEKARREGLLVLEDDAAKIEDSFLQKGVQLVVDGTDMELVKSILHTELAFLEERHKVGENIFMTLGGFAPTAGIIGTVMGLMFALGKGVEDPTETAKAIAVAFLATFYGIASANMIFIPIANKLKLKSQQEILLREVMIEGILSIQAGDNPRIVEEKLKAFLPPVLREKPEEKGEKGKEAEGVGGAPARAGAR